MPAAAQSVLLGDLSAFVSLSGYRLRLLAENAGGDPRLVVVGMPSEHVTLTFLVREGPSSWVVRTREVVVGPSGRSVVPPSP